MQALFEEREPRCVTMHMTTRPALPHYALGASYALATPAGAAM